MNLLRLIKDFGQNRAATAIGISPAEMSRRLSSGGRFSISEMERLCDALGLDSTAGRIVMGREEYAAHLAVLRQLAGQVIVESGGPEMLRGVA